MSNTKISEDQVWSVVDRLLANFEKEYAGGGYSYTTSTPDKRYKSGRRETSHWVSIRYRERTSPERKALIKQLITDVSHNENFTILEGRGYLRFFVYMRYPLLRNKVQRTIKRRVIKNYKDIPSHKEELKEFKSEYRISEFFGPIVRLLFALGIGKNSSAYDYYKRINTL